MTAAAASVACRWAGVCVCVLPGTFCALQRECVCECMRAHVLGNGGRAVGFYLFQMCCVPDEPPEGF